MILDNINFVSEKQEEIWSITTSKLDIKSVESASKQQTEGMNQWLAAVFSTSMGIVTGFLVLPSTISILGWFAVPLIVLTAALACFGGSKLGTCWMILEERWPEYRNPVRRPFAEIGYRAYGVTGRYIVMAMVNASFVGAGVIYIIMIAQFCQTMLPSLSFCWLLIIVGLVLTPVSWLGSPKDFWVVTLIAVLCTAVASILISYDLLLHHPDFHIPEVKTPSFDSVISAMGTFFYTFAFGSGSPPIQSDMRKKQEFSKSLVFGCLGLLIICIPLAVISYVTLGTAIPENIILYSTNTSSVIVKIVTSFAVLTVVAGYLICVAPMCQTIEEVMNIPCEFGWRRIIFRSSVTLLLIILALAFPDAGLVINIVGGATVSMTTFVLPALFYFKLIRISKENKEWEPRSISRGEKMLLLLMMAFGLVFGVLITENAAKHFVGRNLSASCLSQLF